MAKVGSRHEGAIKMDSLDEGVGSYDIERTAARLDYRGVVANPGRDPGRSSRHAGTDSVDEVSFAQVADGDSGGQTRGRVSGRNPPPVSRGSL